MRARLPALVLATALLGACAGLPPARSPQQPAPGLPASFPSAPAASTAAQPAEAIGWQAFFQDEPLRRLIDTALRNNRDLRLATLAIEQARAQMQLREADLLPTVGLGLSGSRTPNGAGGFNNLYLGGLQMTAYELDLFGRLRGLSAAAAAQFQATEAQRLAARISLVAAVAQGYLNLQADEALLALTRQTLVSREDTLRLTETRHRLGAASLLEVRAAQSLLEGARVGLAQQQRQRALDENALSLLLGTPLAATGVGIAPLAGLTAFPELTPGLPSEVLARRPDLRAAELQMAAADAGIEAARANFFPRITLTASAGSATRSLTSLFSAGSFAAGVAGQLFQPLFDAGRNQAALQSANLSRDQALLQYERAVQQAFREVADALATRSTLLDQVAAQQAQVRAEAGRAALVEARHRHGAASYLELLDAQRSLFAAQQSLVLVQGQAGQSLVTLYKTLGGGWQ
ncbi:MAG: efflux transporter outer membrane subunit [Betaproteobacteria bacterium]|nr:efflux transporter outer membrane subunit [Betaproteobacteria bacterium]